MTYKKLFMFDSFQNLVFFFTFGRLHFFRKLQSLTNRCSDTLLMILNESLNMSQRYNDYVTSFITGTIFVTDMCHQFCVTILIYIFTLFWWLTNYVMLRHRIWLIPKKENFFLLLDPLPEAAILAVRSLIYFHVAKVDFFLSPIQTIYSLIHLNSIDPTESIFLEIGLS